MTNPFIAPAKHYYMVSSESPASIQGAIFELLTLSDGWHYGSGIAPQVHSAVSASHLAGLLCKTSARDIGAFPNVDGGVMINSTIGHCYREIVCRDDGLFDLLIENENSGHTEFQEAIKPTEVLEQLGGLEWQPKTSSVSFTPDILMKKEAGSLPRRLSDPEVMEGLL